MQRFALIRTMRSPRGLAAATAGLLAALGLAACAPAGGRQAPDAAAESAAPNISTASTLVHRRDLPGAGAVAFDPTGPRLAWAAGNEVRILDLHTGAQSPLAAGAWVSDLGFAPDGSLWAIADRPARWREGERVCRAVAVEADRLLALDAQGAVVAGYSHSDGTGMLRRQIWLDAQCAVTAESTQPLPRDVQDADSDTGEPLRRASLRPPRFVPASAPHPPDAAQARAVAATSDGRWWVFDHGGSRSLWEAAPRR
jgi:hypothetical protein